MQSLLVACGGGGGGDDSNGDEGPSDGGIDVPAASDNVTLTEGNIDQLSQTAIEGARYTNRAVDLEALARLIVPNVLDGGSCADGGDIAIQNLTATFTECKFGEYTMNGSASGSFTGTSFDTAFNSDFVLNDGVTDQNLSGVVIKCLNAGQILIGNVDSCELDTLEFTGTNGLEYRLGAFSALANEDNSELSIDSAIIFDPLGQITLSTDGILEFDCDDGLPSAGTLQVNVPDATIATIEIVGCSSYDYALTP